LSFVSCGLNNGIGNVVTKATLSNEQATVCSASFDSNIQVNLCCHQARPNIEVHYIRSVKTDEEKYKDFSEEDRRFFSASRTFVLRSNVQRSFYQLEDDAKVPDKITESSANGVHMRRTRTFGFFHSNFYKDFEERKTVDQRFLMEGTFLIEGELREFDWTIGSETIDISGYTCRMAILNTKGGEVKAWFTEDIPIPDGPSVYQGLPGLILKVEMQDTEIYATKIRFLEDLQVHRPTAGKKVTKEEMEQILNAYRNQQDYDRTEGNRRTIRKTITVD